MGALLVVGPALTGGVLWRRSPAAAVARLLLAGAGVGFVLAGPAPADVNENQHVLGALLIMAMGNIGLFPAGFSLAEDVPAPLRWGASVPGVTAITAFGLFLSHRHLGVGMGGMERVAALPLLFWALAVGVRGLIRRGGGVCRRRYRESVSAALVESSGRVPVGLPRGVEIGPGLLQRGGRFDVALLQPGDPSPELVGVRWGSEP